MFPWFRVDEVWDELRYRYMIGNGGVDGGAFCRHGNAESQHVIPPVENV